ncbi:MAG: phosphate ABC transporter permease PstA [Verrucomicrobia bacterium]|nr:phosphate ABC transporter permease PstA [Verrucomicrobiota bacterium]
MRRALDRGLILAGGICAALAAGVLATILGAITWRGASAISWPFLTEQIQRAGASGGVLFNISGTLILLGAALLVSLPVASALALLHSVYLRSERARQRLWMLLAVWSGVPSIVFGLFGLMLFVKTFGWGKSWLSGGVLLGMMMLPTVSVALIERIHSLPRKYGEAAAALGLSQSQVIWSVILPQCANGLVTGLLLGLARAAGETAPIMFTATIFSGAALPHGIQDSPVLTLPYHIFVLSQDSLDPAAGARVWGAALVLLGLVMALSLVALPARLRIHEEALRG